MSENLRLCIDSPEVNTGMVQHA